MKRRNATYDTRYRHKLNMLEPGSLLLKIAAALAALGVLCGLMGWQTAQWALLGVAGLIVGAVLLLVAVELHQDRVLNDIAQEEMKKKPQ